jgi:transposase
MPADARIEGRLIVVRPEDMKEDLYLFTTLDEPTEQVIALYKERWNIETDLRSLKEQVRLLERALSRNLSRAPDIVAYLTKHLSRCP